MTMTNEKILASCDHTLLKQQSTWQEIRALCDEAMKYHTASVCIPPCYVERAAQYMKRPEGVRVCTVIGFPNGYNCQGCGSGPGGEGRRG